MTKQRFIKREKHLYYNMKYNPEKEIEVDLNNPKIKKEISDAKATYGIWQHVAWTWFYNGTGTSVTAYKNGVAQANGYMFGIIAYPNRYVGIGTYGGMNYYNGSVDDVMLFNRSLSAEQIKLIFNNKTNILSSEETNVNDIWQANITVNNRTIDSKPVESNYLEIL